MKPVLLQRLAHLKPNLEVHLETRLPTHVSGPCTLHCDWSLDPYPQYSILTLKLTGDLTLTCLRCAETYTYPFRHENKIAFCRNQSTLEQLMPEMDCLLIEELPADFNELITDELHLYVPEKHDSCGSP